ncbi:MAG: TonB-dependent receptor [Prevotella sp.]|jgi:TonB-linked SusC/RagA family outer membrane protein|nr:TonB-dependent receptor [Prevotella sp.]
MKINFNRKILLLALCLFQCFMYAGAQTKSAAITLDMKDKPVGEIIDKIKQVSNYVFLYNSKEVDRNRKATVQVVAAPIEKVLDQLLSGTNNEYKVDGRQVLIRKKAAAAKPQPTVKPQKAHVVTGVVSDSKGEPLIGVSVVEKGKKTGTITDLDGQFRIEVGDNATLTLSYIGFLTQDIAVGSRTDLKVTMHEDVGNLEEVVVVGYGTQKKVNLTGAVAQIKGEELENRSVSNIGQALQGQIANLNMAQTSVGGEPGATLSMNIRGYTGFGSKGSPLVVIDGIQSGDVNDVNMNDVETITVLKDAASAAIYGSSAPYGVILITTKKGKTGQKPTITYSNNFWFAQPINLPKMMNSIDGALLQNEACANAGVAPMFTDETIQKMRDYQAGLIKDQTMASDVEGVDAYLDGSSAWANNDWFDIMFKDVSFSQQHNLGVSGGTDKTNYYAGLGYTEQGGMWEYGDDKYHRYNAKANMSTDITKWLSMSLRGAFFRAETDKPDLNGSEASYMNIISRWQPSSPLYYPNGNLTPRIGMAQAGRDKTTRDNAILTGEFSLHPLDGLNITANYTFDGTYYNATAHSKTTYATTPSGKIVATSTGPNSFSRTQSRSHHYTVNAHASYEKQLSGHYFKALGGYTSELFDDLSLSAGNNYLYNDNNPSLTTAYGSNLKVGESASQLAIRGVFGRINYNYNERYLFEFDGRYDGTSRFLKDVRWKFYPGVSAAWALSKEAFWESLLPYANLVKFRVEYGSLGDQSFTGRYPFYPSLGTVPPTSSNYFFSGGRESYVSNPGIVNTALTWVTVTSIDYGIDLAFLSNRLNVSFDHYKRRMDDYVGPAEMLPAVLGASVPQTNSAAMETTGFEVSVEWKHRVNNDFSYGAKAVLSDYTGKVLKYPNPNKLLDTWYDGQTMGEIWGYDTYGLFQSDEEIAAAPDQTMLYSTWTPGDVRYKDLNNDGKIEWGENTVDNPGDRTVIGNSTPRYSYGVTLNAEYKGFDFAVFVQGIGKRDALIQNTATSTFLWGITGDAARSIPYTVHYDRWTPDNPNGYFPKYYMDRGQMSKNMQLQSRYLQDASYMRVKNVQIGYSLPASLLSKISCQKMRVFANVENLFLFTNMIKTINPEFSELSGFYSDINAKTYPLQRTWSCGVNVTF